MLHGNIVKDQLLWMSAHPPMRRGMTLIELLVTMLIVTIVSVMFGFYFVKLLNIHEDEREMGYVRERLVDICAAYADYLSIASSIRNITDYSFDADYRQETGGVSLETGRVSRVTHLNTYLDSSAGRMELNIGRIVTNEFVSGFSRKLRGDALLMNMTNDLVLVRRAGIPEAMLTRLNGTSDETASLFYLMVSARCKCEDDNGNAKYRYVTAGRIVRLWNKE